jgi:hypothetical protein
MHFIEQRPCFHEGLAMGAVGREEFDEPGEVKKEGNECLRVVFGITAILTTSPFLWSMQSWSW